MARTRDAAPQIKGPACSNCGRTFGNPKGAVGTTKCPWCGGVTKIRKVPR